MKQVYSAGSLIDAQIVKDHLMSLNIECIIKGELLLGAIGEIPADTNPTVWVIDERDYDLALEKIKNFESDRTMDQMHFNVWKCCKCNELIEPQFTQCWNCGATRKYK